MPREDVKLAPMKHADRSKFGQGFEARRNGVSAAANPFVGVDELFSYEQWADGWRACDAHGEDYIKLGPKYHRENQ